MKGCLSQKVIRFLSMDDGLLAAQRVVAQAALESALASVSTAAAARDTAQINYDLALLTARAEAVSSRTSDWFASNILGYSLPGGYFSSQELLLASKAEVDSAKTIRDIAQSTLKEKLNESASTDFVTAENNLLKARFSEQSALDALNRATLSLNQDLIDAARAVYDEMQKDTESAQADYDDLAGSQVAKDIISLRLDLSIAQERYESAQDRLMQLQVGEASPKLELALAALNQADLAVIQANSLVSQAQAQLDFLMSSYKN